MFYCNECDHLVDSDAVLFVYEHKADRWTCADCLEAEFGEEKTEQILEDFNSRWVDTRDWFVQMLFMNKARKSNKRNLESHKEEHGK